VIVVLEIVNPEGQRANEEYDVPSFQSVMRAVPRELKDYPQFRIADIWASGGRIQAHPRTRSIDRMPPGQRIAADRVPVGEIGRRQLPSLGVISFLVDRSLAEHDEERSERTTGASGQRDI
jgi:hypothetical protein